MMLFETVEGTVVCIEVKDEDDGEVDPGDDEQDDEDEDDDDDDVKELAKITGGGDGRPEVSPPIFPLLLRLDKIDEIDDERLRGDNDDERENCG